MRALQKVTAVECEHRLSPRALHSRQKASSGAQPSEISGAAERGARLRRGGEAKVRALIAMAVVAVELPQLRRLVPGVQHGNALSENPCQLAAVQHT